ncbi:hypothetical protein B005_0459 [Nocardiopsis alba ATCC BAA-2165]|uniref:Uncharacterized protein n=1 Tax=Nocardiopsis alba (strain ATCC BAA-2165 / BE74) TaxID=1205910 RepID=J7LBZ4_NOCAA|nr:hypothetical protein B005_0459 [Nocardiopsis alba ATCC BAA-2165]
MPYGLTVENGYYDDETIWDVVDEDGNAVPMRTPEFNGTVGDA